LETQQEMLSMKAVFLQIHAASIAPQFAVERRDFTQACWWCLVSDEGDAF